MGLDIYGWIEVKDRIHETWHGMIKVDNILMLDDKNPILREYLFSPSRLNKIAIAAWRGIPKDVSEEVKNSKIMQAYHAHSWLLFSELKAIEWQQSEDKHETFLVFEGEKIIVTGGWELVFELMTFLAKYHGEENVRLVVSFG